MTAAVRPCRLQIQARGLELMPGERAKIQRWFRFTLGKLESGLRQVKITMELALDATPARVSCRIVARDRHDRIIRAESKGRDVGASVTRALRRAERATRRSAGRVLGAQRQLRV